jgi:hypothetical protein
LAKPNRSFVSYTSAIGFDAVKIGFAAMYAIWLSTNFVIMKKVLSHTWSASASPLEMKSLKGDTSTYNEVRGYQISDGSICQIRLLCIMITRALLVGYRYPVPSWLLRIQTIARIRSSPLGAGIRRLVRLVAKQTRSKLSNWAGWIPGPLADGRVSIYSG